MPDNENTESNDLEVGDQHAVDPDGSSMVPVRLDGTVTRLDSDGRRILTDSIDPGQHLLRNKVDTAEEIAHDAVNAPTQQAAAPKAKTRKTSASSAEETPTPPADEASGPSGSE